MNTRRLISQFKQRDDSLALPRIRVGAESGVFRKRVSGSASSDADRSVRERRGRAGRRVSSRGIERGRGKRATENKAEFTKRKRRKTNSRAATCCASIHHGLTTRCSLGCQHSIVSRLDYLYAVVSPGRCARTIAHLRCRHRRYRCCCLHLVIFFVLISKRATELRRDGEGERVEEK